MADYPTNEFVQSLAAGYKLGSDIADAPLARKKKEMEIEDIASSIGMRNVYTQEAMRKMANEARAQSVLSAMPTTVSEEQPGIPVPAPVDVNDLLNKKPMTMQPAGIRTVQRPMAPMEYQETLARKYAEAGLPQAYGMMKDVATEQRLQKTQQQKDIVDGFNVLKILKDFPDAKTRQTMVDKMAESFPVLKGIDAGAWAENPSLQEIPLKNGATAVIYNGKLEIVKSEASKAPTVHTFLEGDMHVDKQWNPVTNQWDVVSKAPRYKESSESPSDKEEKRNEVLLERTNAAYNQEIKNVENQYDASERSGVKMDTEEWNRKMLDVKKRYEPRFRRIKTKDAPNGWSVMAADVMGVGNPFKGLKDKSLVIAKGKELAAQGKTKEEVANLLKEAGWQ